MIPRSERREPDLIKNRDHRDCSGHRDIPGLSMSRSAKDEALDALRIEFDRLHKARDIYGDEFSEQLSEDERLLVAWFMGVVRKVGRLPSSKPSFGDNMVWRPMIPFRGRETCSRCVRS